MSYKTFIVIPTGPLSSLEQELMQAVENNQPPSDDMLASASLEELLRPFLKALSDDKDDLVKAMLNQRIDLLYYAPIFLRYKHTSSYQYIAKMMSENSRYVIISLLLWPTRSGYEQEHKELLILVDRDEILRLSPEIIDDVIAKQEMNDLDLILFNLVRIKLIVRIISYLVNKMVKSTDFEPASVIYGYIQPFLSLQDHIDIYDYLLLNNMPLLVYFAQTYFTLPEPLLGQVSGKTVNEIEKTLQSMQFYQKNRESLLPAGYDGIVVGETEHGVVFFAYPNNYPYSTNYLEISFNHISQEKYEEIVLAERVIPSRVYYTSTGLILQSNRLLRFFHPQSLEILAYYLDDIPQIMTHNMDNMLNPLNDALSYLHSYGLAHGSVSPYVIYYDSEHHKLYLDGFNYICSRRLIENNQCDRPEKVHKAYVPPEILFESGPITLEKLQYADIWGLAVTLFRVAYGVLPYDPDDPQSYQRLPALNNQTRLRRALNPAFQLIFNPNKTFYPTIKDFKWNVLQHANRAY